MQKAQPPVKKSKPVAVKKSALAKSQDDFSESGKALATELGWEGEDLWVANGIQVKDACAFLTKSLHEAYGAKLSDKIKAPTVASVAAHLGLTEEDDLAKVEKALGDAASSAQPA